MALFNNIAYQVFRFNSYLYNIFLNDSNQIVSLYITWSNFLYQMLFLLATLTSVCNKEFVHKLSFSRPLMFDKEYYISMLLRNRH